jgi:2-phosphosulfolactate phosphatase
MTTTNGTHALSVSRGADEVICGSLLNASAVARYLGSSGRRRLLIVCAGTDGEFSLDDAIAAGAIIDRLSSDDRSDDSLSDSATAALVLYRSVADDIPSAFLHSLHGRRLVELGLGDDVRYCASVDTIDVVPMLTGNSIAPATDPVVVQP